MLDAVRKEFWSPGPDVLEKLAAVHSEIVSEYGASCSYNVCGNKSLRDFIVNNLSEPEAYQKAVDEAIQDPSSKSNVSGLELVEKVENNKDDVKENSSAFSDAFTDKKTDAILLAGIAVAVLLLLALGFMSEKRAGKLR